MDHLNITAFIGSSADHVATFDTPFIQSYAPKFFIRLELMEKFDSFYGKLIQI